MKTLILFAIALFATVLASAQGSGGGSTGVGGGGGSTDFGTSGFDVLKTVQLHVVEVRPDGGVVVVDEAGTRVAVKLDKHYVIKANKGTELAGKKKLAIADLQAGMLLKITYRAADLVAVELRIVKDAEKS
jgi:hypothetical protein